jgi:hypothetical protein
MDYKIWRDVLVLVYLVHRLRDQLLKNIVYKTK